MSAIPVFEVHEGLPVWSAAAMSRVFMPKYVCKHMRRVEDNEFFWKIPRALFVPTDGGNGGGTICLDCLLEWASTLTTEDESEADQLFTRLVEHIDRAPYFEVERPASDSDESEVDHE